MSAPPLLIQVQPEELPEAYRRLIDPDIPLAEPERFLPEAFPGSVLAKIGLGVTLALAALFGKSLVIAAMAVVRSGALGDWGNLAASTGLFGALMWLARHFWLRIRTGHRQAAEHARGRYRLGVFLTRDALVSYLGKHCYLVPRERLTTEFRAAPTADGGAQSATLHFVYTDDAGHRSPLHGALTKNSRGEDVVLDGWIKTGMIRTR